MCLCRKSARLQHITIPVIYLFVASLKTNFTLLCLLTKSAAAVGCNLLVQMQMSDVVSSYTKKPFPFVYHT